MAFNNHNNKFEYAQNHEFAYPSQANGSALWLWATNKRNTTSGSKPITDKEGHAKESCNYNCFVIPTKVGCPKRYTGLLTKLNKWKPSSESERRTLKREQYIFFVCLAVHLNNGTALTLPGPIYLEILRIASQYTDWRFIVPNPWKAISRVKNWQCTCLDNRDHTRKF